MTQAPEKKEKVVINNTERVEEFRKAGGRIIHSISHRERPMTFAVQTKGRRAFVATSLCHPNDQFSKKMGTLTALDNYSAGRVVTLPFNGDTNNLIWSLRNLND